MVIIGSNLIAHTEYMVQSTLQLIVAMIAAISRAVACCFIVKTFNLTYFLISELGF